MTMSAVYQSLASYVSTYHQQLGDHESVLGMMYNCYKDQNNMETEEIKTGFEMLYALLNGRSSDETEEFIDAVCALCSEHERVGFIEGIRIDIRLVQEADIQRDFNETFLQQTAQISC